jgi:hypothetical protein
MRAMSTPMRVSIHPSNRLYRGECVDFRDAVRTYIAALRYELSLPFGDDEFGRDLARLLRESIEQAEYLLAEYERVIGEAERTLFREWAATTDDDTTRMIGQAALEGDYSVIAI